MSKQEKRKVIMPSYLKRFRCIGEACEDICCAASWGIVLDRQSYNKIKRVKHPELSPLIHKHIARNRSNPSEQSYARIRFNGREFCPFLNDVKLCRIQMNLGENYLNNVCVTYPRYTNIVDGLYEKVATLSCPEAARLAILNPEGIDFEEVEESGDSRIIPNLVLNTSGMQSKNINASFWELRTFSIQLLKSRDYSIWERLIILGLFINNLQELIIRDNLREIPVLINKYEERTVLSSPGYN